MLFNKQQISDLRRAPFFAALFVLLMAGGLVGTSAYADVRIELEGTEISAARELPKVLYLVPWQQNRPDSRPLPMRSLIDETLSPVEMDVFKRRVRYFELTIKKP